MDKYQSAPAGGGLDIKAKRTRSWIASSTEPSERPVGGKGTKTEHLFHGIRWILLPFKRSCDLSRSFSEEKLELAE